MCDYVENSPIRAASTSEINEEKKIWKIEKIKEKKSRKSEVKWKKEFSILKMAIEEY